MARYSSSERDGPTVGVMARARANWSVGLAHHCTRTGIICSVHFLFKPSLVKVGFVLYTIKLMALVPKSFQNLHFGPTYAAVKRVATLSVERE